MASARRLTESAESGTSASLSTNADSKIAPSAGPGPVGSGGEPEKGRAQGAQGQDGMMSQVGDLQEAETDRGPRGRMEQRPCAAPDAVAGSERG
jgi:hypothetical protein